jgi:hypothetical protein
MVEVRELAARILAILHDEAEKSEDHEVSITSLYKTLEKQFTYDDVQRAIKFLVDRDLIAPSGYSLTAKGRREYSFKTPRKT